MRIRTWTSACSGRKKKSNRLGRNIIFHKKITFVSNPSSEVDDFAVISHNIVLTGCCALVVASKSFLVALSFYKYRRVIISRFTRAVNNSHASPCRLLELPTPVLVENSSLMLRNYNSQYRRRWNLPLRSILKALRFIGATISSIQRCALQT